MGSTCRYVEVNSILVVKDGLWSQSTVILSVKWKMFTVFKIKSQIHFDNYLFKILTGYQKTKVKYK